MQTSLLAFNNTSITCQEAVLLECSAVGITINSVQCTSNAKTDCTCLTRNTATVNTNDDIELSFKLEQNDWGVYFTLEKLSWEVFLKGAAINGPLASSWNKADTCNGFLATASAITCCNGRSTSASSSIGLRCVGNLIHLIFNCGSILCHIYHSFLDLNHLP